MAKIPKNPSEIFEEISGDYKKLFGDDLISIILYGSGAKGEYRYKRSDINLLIVLSDNGIEQLRKCLPLVSKWKKRNVTTPLFFTKQYIRSSLDSFPVEFLDMQLNHQLVFGEDILMDIIIDKQNLRLQCERELRGKLLHLREGFLNYASKPRQLRIFVAQSLSAFTTLFTALLRLKETATPQKRRDIFSKTVDVFGLESTVFENLLEIRENQKKLSKEQLYQLMEQYINEIRKLTQVVDQL